MEIKSEFKGRKNMKTTFRPICRGMYCDHQAGNRLNGYCQSCYRYLCVEKKRQYPLPKKGEMAYAENGDIICHICGKAYHKLGNHIAFFHKILVKDYMKIYELPKGTKLSHPDCIKLMHDRQLPYKDEVVGINLIQKGKDTRFDGQKGNQMTLSTNAWTGRCKGCRHLQGEICTATGKPCKEIIRCTQKS